MENMNLNVSGSSVLALEERHPTITDIINASLRSTLVPIFMKSAVVTPLLKKLR